MRRFTAVFLVALFSVTALSHALTMQWVGVTRVMPVQQHGHLAVSGSKLVSQNGEVVSFAGPSFFWSNTGWGQEAFYNTQAVRNFARDWDADIIRASIGVDGDGSLLRDPQANMARAETIIQAAIANNIYVVVDYHSHEAEKSVPQAQEFFAYLAQKYGHTPNIIYEIYNEPLVSTDWDTVIKPYAETMIQTIRRYDPDNIIVVGTQSYSQDLERVIANPIRGASNIMYALHFYAAGHKDDLRARAERALQAGLPVMVTEWGTVNYDGDGAVDRASSEAWLALMRRHDLTHMMWAVSSKNEGASMFTSTASKTGPWTDADLTSSGRYARDIIKGWK
ncbi:cellulase family glycosylhydrolase [Fretibacter rubidus]|uniref:cellulase family glycosylhydrolase n=1 Tax=Fretibacter rubidus TaxID=570162 RepID=UPI00352AE43D